MLADKINEENNKKYTYNFNRSNCHNKRCKNEIGFSSIRGGDIIGSHSVLFFSENELFEIKHISHSRKIFAEGAIKAAEFIVTKSPGKIYDMNNLISDFTL